MKFDAQKLVGQIKELEQREVKVQAFLRQLAVAVGVLTSSARSRPRQPHRLSPAARQRIALAQKKRWAAFRAKRVGKKK